MLVGNSQAGSRSVAVIPAIDGTFKFLFTIKKYLNPNVLHTVAGCNRTIEGLHKVYAVYVMDGVIV